MLVIPKMFYSDMNLPVNRDLTLKRKLLIDISMEIMAVHRLPEQQSFGFTLTVGPDSQSALQTHSPAFSS